MKNQLKYIFALLLFGSNGIVASRISLTSYEIVMLRSLIGSLLLIGIFFATRQRISFVKSKRDLLYIAISGAAMGASWMFLYEAYQQIGVSLATLANYCGPVIIMALAPLIFKEKLTYIKLIGFAAVLCGVFLVNGQAAAEGKTAWGLFCGGMSAVTYAVMIIFNKKAKHITGLENSATQLFIAFLTVAIFVTIKQGPYVHISQSDWIPLLTLGIVNTGIGCYFYFSSINRLPAQTVAVCGYLEPLSAVIMSVIFLKENLTWLQYMGAALILGGALFAECVKKGKMNPQK